MNSAIFSLNEAKQASPGQRPGFRRRERPALKGRHKSPEPVSRIVSPLQGWGYFLPGDPGRCPGLAWVRPLACKHPGRDVGSAAVLETIKGLLA